MLVFNNSVGDVNVAVAAAAVDNDDDDEDGPQFFDDNGDWKQSAVVNVAWLESVPIKFELDVSDEEIVVVVVSWKPLGFVKTFFFIIVIVIIMSLECFIFKIFFKIETKKKSRGIRISLEGEKKEFF